jgi:hypothetical protein
VIWKSHIDEITFRLCLIWESDFES